MSGDIDGAAVAISNFAGWHVSQLDALVLAQYVADRFGLDPADCLEVARRFEAPPRDDDDDDEIPPSTILRRCPVRWVRR